MIDDVPPAVERAFAREFEEVGTSAIKLRDQGKLTNGHLAVLATLIDREFKKPVSEWTCTPIQLFNSYLAQVLR